MDITEGTGSKSLARELGLYGAFTVSLGAMIGSGIFVLPGLAYETAGPAAILAYFLAGLLVVPAAFSQSEMATAMPQAGGTYLYVDRAMGPLMGTVAGFGTWFALVFKAAFALVGLGAYLSYFADLPVKPVAVGFAVMLIGINVAGIRQSGRFQTLIVTVVLGVLAFYVADGVTLVDNESYRPFFSEGFSGLLAASGLVFVSYAGVTKVASVAEEIERPHRNLPLAILISIALMMVLYPAIVFVIVGVTPAEELTETLTPMATAAETFMGDIGPTVIAVTAVLALLSMANAGLLSSSRYPFAMARRALAPVSFARIGARSGTPVVAITITGTAIVLLVAFVPIFELAKLASAFQLLVLSMVNLAVIAFRESKVPWYRPRFRAPAYPWLQLAGIGGALLFLTEMGWDSIVGALAIVVVAVAWYRLFGQSRASRESASLDALRLRTNTRLVAQTEQALAGPGKSHILIPVRRDIPGARLRDLIRVAGSVAAPDGRIDVLRFEEVPFQINLESAAGVSEEDLAFEQGVHAMAGEQGVTVHAGEVVGHDRRRALINYVTENGVDLLLAEMPRPHRRGLFRGGEVRWLREGVDCDTAFLRNREVGSVDSIAVMGAGGPFDALKVHLADRIAMAESASVRFVHVLGTDATDSQVGSIVEYHGQLEGLSPVPTESLVERSDDLVEALGRIAHGSGLVILGAPLHTFPFFADLADRISDRVECAVLLVEARDTFRRTFLGRALEKLIY